MHEIDYLKEMIRYYNGARVPQKPGDAGGFRKDVERDPNHWAHEMVQDLRAFVSGRRVLEVACGMGPWTQFAAETADFVLATDAAPNLLANAEGLRLPRDRVRFYCVNAFRHRQLERRVRVRNALELLQSSARAGCCSLLVSAARQVGAGRSRLRGRSTIQRELEAADVHQGWITGHVQHAT